MRRYIAVELQLNWRSKVTFEDFWKAWPKSDRKGAKSQCLAKWKKFDLDEQVETVIAHVNYMKTTDQWKKDNGAFIPAPLVYLNQQRWDGAEIPEVNVNVTVSFKDPALEKIELDRKQAKPMSEEIRQKIRDLTRSIKSV